MCHYFSHYVSFLSGYILLLVVTCYYISFMVLPIMILNTFSLKVKTQTNLPSIFEGLGGTESLPIMKLIKQPSKIPNSLEKILSRYVF